MPIVTTGFAPGREQLFNRVARLTVGLQGTNVTKGNALQVTGLRIQASIKRTTRPEPSQATISIFNLTRDHRAQIKKRGLPIILEAGYSNTLAQIYSGQVRWVDHVRTGADWVSKIQCGDGEISYRYARLAQSWGPSTPVRTVATALVNVLGVQAAGTAAVLASIPGSFPRGYAIHGMASKELDRLLYGRGFEWHFQDGRVMVLPQGAATAGTAILLNQTTGLVGSPEHATPDPAKPFDSGHTLKIKALLLPTIRPAGLVQVQAEGIGATSPAFYRAQTVEHTLDTQEGSYYTDIEGWPA